MRIVACIIAVLGVAWWFYLGLVCLTAMDSDWDNSELLEWADKCPIGGIFTIAMIWPVIIYYVNKLSQEGKEEVR